MRRFYSVAPRKFKDADGNVVTKFFANSVSAEHYSSEDMARDISEASSLSKADVIGALRAFSEILEAKLKMGYNVKLDRIGTFSLSVTSDACDTEKECKPNKVRFKKIAFKADNRLRKEMGDVKFFRTTAKRRLK